MKRFWIAILTLSLAASLSLGIIPASAAEETWRVYATSVDADGRPQYIAPPAHLFTDRGLEVVPSSGMTEYTVQTASPYSLDDGIYLEVRLSRQVEAGFLVFSVWEQDGVKAGNPYCGSGWQGMVSLGKKDEQFMIGLNVTEASAEDPDGRFESLGTIVAQTPTNDDGSVTYTLSIREDILRVNGRVVAGTDDIFPFLKSVREDNCFYMGVSVIVDNATTGVPITVTRFGTSSNTASVPGQENTLPETGEASSETLPVAPETDLPADPPADDTDLESLPTETEREPVSSEPVTNLEEGTADEPPQTEKVTYEEDPDSPFRETESETREIHTNDNMKDFISKLEGMASNGCGSLIGSGCLGTMLLIGAGFLYVRKKRS